VGILGIFANPIVDLGGRNQQYSLYFPWLQGIHDNGGGFARDCVHRQYQLSGPALRPQIAPLKPGNCARPGLILLGVAAALSPLPSVGFADHTVPSRVRAFPPRIIALAVSGIESDWIRSTVSYCPMS
jgi:hypothetical protein